jgi:MFS family permease
MFRRIFYGWVIVVISIVNMIFIYGIRHSFPVFFPSILAEFGWSRGSTAMMLSLNILIYGFLAPFAGILINRWRPRRIMPLGILLLSIATACCAFAHELWHFYLLFGMLMPLGSAFSGWPILAPTLMNWFAKRRGLVMGLGQMGGGLSFSYSMFVAFTISKVGWRDSYLVLAIILVVLLVPLSLLFFYYHPEDKGLKPYGANEISPPKNSTIGQVVAKNPFFFEKHFYEVLRARQLWFLILSYAFYWGIGGYLVLAHQVKFAQDAGYSSMFSVSIFALFGITLFFGQFFGFISDWLGREKTGTLAACLSIGGLCALISVRDTSQTWLLYVYSICFGFGGGIFSPTIFAASADIFYGRYYGAVVGLLLMGMGVGGIMGPWLGGYLFDLSGSYMTAFVLCILSIGLGCLFLWVAAPRKAGRQRRLEAD